MANIVLEDAGRTDFDPLANTSEFVAVMPYDGTYGVRAFTISISGQLDLPLTFLGG